jgi:uncharacterized repeat protein (TIGR03803 family)
MARPEQQRSSAFARLAGMAGLLILLVTATAAQAQTYKVIHDFTGGQDGQRPFGTLTADGAGNLYGSAGNTVFKMMYRGSGWVLNPLYIFTGGFGGTDPLDVVFGPDGSLYGTAGGGGDPYCNCGLVFKLRPSPTSPRSVFSPWNETVLYAFTGSAGDGAYPYSGVILDRAGNIYGTTEAGGGGLGTAYQLTPSSGQWTETVIDKFRYPTNGPYSAMIMDAAGNLYGTTGDGTKVYELSPSEYGWVETILHTFPGGYEGGLAYGGLVMDQAGNLYGATADGGTYGGGIIYELSPSDNGWTFQILFSFVGAEGPFASLAMDGAGNLYGMTFADGTTQAGNVFELSPSNGGWMYIDLHDFSFDAAYFPEGGVTLDGNGNLFGMTSQGGAYGHGVVWEITP